MRFVKFLPEFFVCAGVLAGDDDLGSGEAVTGRVSAGGVFAFGRRRAGT